MIEKSDLLSMSLAAVALLTCITSNQQVSAKSQSFFERPGILARHILEARGYLAEDFNLVSEDGYRIRITRGRNPLINGGQGGLPGRAPILFIHGILESSNVFVVNSFDVRPSDFSKINLKGVPLEELNAKLGDLPSAKSLPFLAMDFGHEVFLMSRRGFPGSQKKVGDPNEGVEDEAAGQQVTGPLSKLWRGLTNYGHLAQEIRFSLDRKFWNFSADEQARYDWPLAVNFVRENTKRDKIALVGHSLGGAISLMAMSLFPELDDKIAAAVFWSQAFAIGHGDYINGVSFLQPLFHHYVGPLPPIPIVGHLQRALNVMCASRLSQATLCAAIADSLQGLSAGQAPMRPEFVNSLFYTSSSHEFEQSLQAALLDGQMHYYGASRLKQNLKPYNLSAITNTKLSFYMPMLDNFVSIFDGQATLPKLRVAHRTHPIVHAFNHQGYFYHKNNSRLAIIPSLKDIQELSEPPLPPSLVVSEANLSFTNANTTTTTTATATTTRPG